MSMIPTCPTCQSPYAYIDRELFICPECGHEWATEAETIVQITDINGNVLADNDAVIITKDLKVKGSSSVIKKGTKVKSIKLTPNGRDGHDIDCKIDGFGAMQLKSEFVKKI